MNKKMLSSKSHQKFLTRHQAKVDLMSVMNNDSNSDWSSDYLAIRGNKQSFLGRVCSSQLINGVEMKC